MSSLEEQIQELEAELTKTPYNKATSKHIGRIKAKIARLRDEAVNRALKSSGGGEGFTVKKSGDATAVLVGFPSTGKSTLLNKLTGTSSAVAAYEFTTLTVVPGALEHKGAKIQLLDMPGLIAGAAMGKGRGKEVIGVVRGGATQDDLIDAVQGNRVYIPAFIAVNKVDLVDKERYLEIEHDIAERFGTPPLMISAAAGYHLEEVKDAIYDCLGFIRVYLKPHGGDADLE